MHLIKGGGGEGEEAAAAVGVDEVAGAAGGDLGAHVAGEDRQDEGVILKEVPGEEVEFQVADGFGDDGIVLGGHLAGSVAQ